VTSAIGLLLSLVTASIAEWRLQGLWRSSRALWWVAGILMFAGTTLVYLLWRLGVASEAILFVVACYNVAVAGSSTWLWYTSSRRVVPRE